MKSNSNNSNNNNNYSEGILSEDEPFQRPSIMDQFDQLVLRAAQNKRNDILNRYGDEGCNKLLARKERYSPKKPPRSKSHYEKTIRDLVDSSKKLSPTKTKASHFEEKPTLVQEESTSSTDITDDDFDIDELFELAWGSDISTEFKKETTKKNNRSDNNNNNNNDNNNDEAFAKKLHQGSVRKLLKVRETTRAPRSWRVRKTKTSTTPTASNENCPGRSNISSTESNRSWQWNLA
eukprot:CAMPEP_0116128476 /NCGR_PEP_ID=MMETSP0329-20121206/7380_1 /TAXON_ID=697910 /ORGANISM="Pseudo-nitzschia arenysensis, Strain B593" /LENGTH=234 /DNA_ID=CAMNT_0003622617 /DNA_START=25 /DNA_END=729 /DNA_ORIENTATION=+